MEGVSESKRVRERKERNTEYTRQIERKSVCVCVCMSV